MYIFFLLKFRFGRSFGCLLAPITSHMAFVERGYLAGLHIWINNTIITKLSV
jgi:hypothetical protein